MPKMKKHSGAKKRFKLTGSGKKVRRQQAMLGHIMEKKSSRRVRRLTGTTDVSSGDVKRVKKLLHI